MAKNVHKKAKEKEIKFTILKSKFVKNLKEVLAYKGKIGICGVSVSTSVLLEVDNDQMALTATDGNALLTTTTKLGEPVKEKAKVILNGEYLEKLAIKRDYFLKSKDFSLFDVLEICIKNEYTEIKDVRNNIIYNIPYIDGQYPKYEKLFPEKIVGNEDFTIVALNPAYLARMAKIDKPIVLAVNKDPKKSIYFQTGYNGGEIQRNGIIMPVILQSVIGGYDD